MKIVPSLSKISTTLLWFILATLSRIHYIFHKMYLILLILPWVLRLQSRKSKLLRKISWHFKPPLRLNRSKNRQKKPMRWLILMMSSKFKLTLNQTVNQLKMRLNKAEKNKAKMRPQMKIPSRWNYERVWE